MALWSVHALALGDLVTTGPDPFSGHVSTNGAAIGVSTLRLPAGAGWSELRINDTDTGPTPFEDTDQTLAHPIAFNGTAWAAGIDVENEYSYVLRPIGATDASQDVTIYALQFAGGAVQGIAASGPIQREVTYRLISGDSSPATSYSSLAICFAPGTMIATPSGWRPVEALGPGDLVDTADHGPQALLWVGAQEVSGRGARAVRLAPGVLDNHRALVLSPQHRVLCDGGLLPVKALAGRPGVTEVRAWRMRYHHLLFAGHRLILAEGAQVESLYPGPMALAALSPGQRAEILALCPELAEGALWPPARPLWRPGRWQRSRLRA